MRRTFLRLALTLNEPFRIGTWLSSDPGQAVEGVRQATATDPDGAIYIPASGLAGSLRAHAGSDAVELFGPTVTKRGDELTPSPWAVRGVVVRAELIATPRGQTAIDRRRRAASNTSYRESDEVAVPSSSEPHLRVYLVGDDAPLDLLLGHLRTWAPTLGGGTSRGLGRARLSEVVHRTLDLGADKDLLELVASDGGPEGIDLLLSTPAAQVLDPRGFEPATHPSWHIECGFRHDLGLAAPKDRETAVQLVKKLHGSALKGLLRARVEFIGRSMGWPVCEPTEDPIGSHRCSSCPEDRMCDDCRAAARCDVCKAFGSTDRPAALAFLSSSVSAVRGPFSRQRVAINRFTGGSQQWQRADNIQGALFPEHTQEAGVFSVTVERRRPVAPWVEQAFLHAWRDLDDGLIAVGPRGAIGLGSIAVRRVSLPDDRKEWDLVSEDTPRWDSLLLPVPAPVPAA